MLTPRLDSLESLFRKLERERYRTFHSGRALHKADHFYNFCVTAHSLRDYLFERLGKTTQSQQKPHADAWRKIPALVAVADIANTAKHFQLREARTKAPRVPTTKAVRRGRTTVVEFYLDPTGKHVRPLRRRVATYYVHLEDGTVVELYAFMEQVLTHWKAELLSHGIRVRLQSARELGVAVA